MTCTQPASPSLVNYSRKGPGIRAKIRVTMSSIALAIRPYVAILGSAAKGLCPRVLQDPIPVMRDILAQYHRSAFDGDGDLQAGAVARFRQPVERLYDPAGEASKSEIMSGLFARTAAKDGEEPLFGQAFKRVVDLGVLYQRHQPVASCSRQIAVRQRDRLQSVFPLSRGLATTGSTTLARCPHCNRWWQTPCWTSTATGKRAS
jgi:hypothetical protein